MGPPEAVCLKLVLQHAKGPLPAVHARSISDQCENISARISSPGAFVYPLTSMPRGPEFAHNSGWHFLSRLGSRYLVISLR